MSSSDMYIYELPFSVHEELCIILDRDKRWEELAGKQMNFSMMKLRDLRRDEERGLSPTNQLLTFLGQQIYSVVHLFVSLSKMHHYHALTVLKPFVHSRYHSLINEGERNISVVLNNGGNSSLSISQDFPGDRGGSEGGSSAYVDCGASAPATSDSGAVPRLSNSHMDENFGSHNFNVQVEEHTQLHQKMLLPPLQETSEVKILNTSVPVGGNLVNDVKENFAVPLDRVDPENFDPESVQLVHKVESDYKENNHELPAHKLPPSKTSFGSPDHLCERTTQMPKERPSPVEVVTGAAAVSPALEDSDEGVASLSTLTLDSAAENGVGDAEPKEDETGTDSQDDNEDTQCEEHTLTSIGKEPLSIFQFGQL